MPKKSNSLTIFLFLALMLGADLSFAAQTTGRAAAQKYFQSDSESGNPTENVLMLHYGQFVSSNAYSWADQSPVSDAGLSTMGVTYLLEQWHGFDLNLRADLINYNVGGFGAQQLVILPMVTFPRAEHKFPLYFGAGLGPGVFVQQLANKSALALDYELVAGLRFMDLYQGVGTFIEAAMKNDFFALSTGQFIGSALEFGFVFNF